MQKINLDFIKRNHNNKINIPINSEKYNNNTNNNKLNKDIKFYKKTNKRL